MGPWQDRANLGSLKSKSNSIPMSDATPWVGFRDADDDDDEAQAHGRGGYADEEAQLLPFELEVDDNIAESSVPARFPSICVEVALRASPAADSTHRTLLPQLPGSSNQYS